MAIYEYLCPEGHRRERVRRFVAKDAPCDCLECPLPMTRVEVSLPHCLPDGMYSYAPNLGSEKDFARRIDAVRDGQTLIKKGD